MSASQGGWPGGSGLAAGDSGMDMAARLETDAPHQLAGPSLPINQLTICIGGLPIAVRTRHPEFLALLADRYSAFAQRDGRARFAFDVHVHPPNPATGDAETEVRQERGIWKISRGDFQGEFDARAGRGQLRLSANPYSIDAFLRIVHSLELAVEGGLLLHAASGIRHGRGYVFSGVSGAGKTTVARLAPTDVRLLTDEISYVRREADGYRVYGTPFSGELAMKGEDVSAPLAAIYLLAHGTENRVTPLALAEAARGLLRNTLFFAHDRDLVGAVFAAGCDLAQRVPVRQLEFVPDTRVWEYAE